jgi:hypothetical protein
MRLRLHFPRLQKLAFWNIDVPLDLSAFDDGEDDDAEGA